MDGSKVAFRQNGKMKWYDYKDGKVYIKDQDNHYIEDVTKVRSEDYDKGDRPKQRSNFNTLYKSVKYISKNKV
jgi:hypothetical protein